MVVPLSGDDGRGGGTVASVVSRGCSKNAYSISERERYTRRERGKTGTKGGTLYVFVSLGVLYPSLYIRFHK